MRRIVTAEEKMALKLIDAVDNSRVWLDLVGVYLFELAPYDLFDRLEHIALTAIEQRDKEIARQQQPQRKLSLDDNPPF